MINCNFHTLYCAKLKMVKSNVEYTGFYYFQQDLNKEPQKKKQFFCWGWSYMRIQFLPDGSLFVLIITNKVVINK